MRYQWSCALAMELHLSCTKPSTLFYISTRAVFQILLCDTCDNGYHTSCLRPPLMIIPDDDWYCPPCEHVSSQVIDILRSSPVKLISGEFHKTLQVSIGSGNDSLQDITWTNLAKLSPWKLLGFFRTEDFKHDHIEEAYLSNMCVVSRRLVSFTA